MSASTYKVINGTSYHEQTESKVVNALEDARVNNLKVRIMFGDPQTGKDWLEEFDVIGTIGRSTGSIKIPLLIKNKRSMGGGALLDHCIVRLLVNGRERYKHPTYHLPHEPALEVKPSTLPEYHTEVWVEGKVHARFKSEQSAKNWIAFMEGKRMCK